ncbi:MAG: hypothetical protein K2W82_12520 [Candidatus Obscuribacterales bacterium]|nr:hypothetical protein [Candidatus Obscuribacterales bacterium]
MPSITIKPITLICGYFVFLAIFVGLNGNFPLNDDWAYGLAVDTFLHEHRFLMPTVCAPGFTHILLGAAACSIFGYSFVTLRCLTLLVAVIGALAFYLLLKEIRMRPWEAAFLTFLYAANPLMLNIYFSYMSDVSALTATNIYLLCLLRAVNRKSTPYATASLFALLIAISIRQSAVIFLPCNLALFSLRNKNRLNIWLIASSLILPCLAYYGVDHWLLTRFKIGHDYELARAAHTAFIQSFFTAPLNAWQATLVGFGQACCYVALFIAPVLIAFATSFFISIKKQKKRFLLLFILAALLLLPSIHQLIYVEHKLMPFNNNLLRLPTIGALGIIGLEMEPWRHGYHTILTVLAYILALIFVVICLACLFYLPTFIAARNLKQKNATWICWLAGYIGLAFSTLETAVRCSDRYYLIVLMPIIMAFALIIRRLKVRLLTAVPIACLVFMVLYGTLAVQDYLNWNRARWLGLERLEQQGINHKEIDGGAEYNILRSKRAIYNSTYRGPAPHCDWRWWPIYGEKYIVSFSPIPNYEIIQRIPFWSSLTFSNKEILILKAAP